MAPTTQLSMLVVPIAGSSQTIEAKRNHLRDHKLWAISLVNLLLLLTRRWFPHLLRQTIRSVTGFLKDRNLLAWSTFQKLSPAPNWFRRLLHQAPRKKILACDQLSCTSDIQISLGYVMRLFGSMRTWLHTPAFVSLRHPIWETAALHRSFFSVDGGRRGDRELLLLIFICLFMFFRRLLSLPKFGWFISFYFSAVVCYLPTV